MEDPKVASDRLAIGSWFSVSSLVIQVHDTVIFTASLERLKRRRLRHGNTLSNVSMVPAVSYNLCMKGRELSPRAVMTR